MLQVKLNNEIKTIGYSVENNLTPSVNNATALLKHMLYTNGYHRKGGGTTSYSSRLSAFFEGYYLTPGMLDNGSFELLDETNTIIGRCDLSRTYSGSDVLRGSVNLNESYRYISNGKVVSRNVLDFPTHAANGAITTVKYNAKGYYDTSAGFSKFPKNNRGKLLFSDPEVEHTASVNVFGTSTPPFLLIFDTEGNMIIYVRRRGVVYYKDKIYKVTGNLNCLYLINGKIYSYKTLDDTNKKFEFSEVIFDNENLNITLSESTFKLNFNVYTNNRQFLIAAHSIGNYIYTVSRDSNRSYYHINKMNLDGTHVDYDYAIISNLHSSSYYVNPFWAVTPILNDDNCLYIRDDNYTISNYIKFDLENKTFTKMSSIEGIKNYLNCSNSSIYGSTSSNFEHKFSYKGKEYAMERDCSSISSDNITDFCIFETEPYKDPLKITMTEPLIKTSEQTMKLIIDIEIE